MFVRRALAATLLCALLSMPGGAAAGQRPYVVGDRVEWNLGGIVFPGTVYRVQDGRYQIDRDGFGRTTDWVNAADLKLIAPAPVTVPMPPAPAQPGVANPPAAVAAPAFKVGDRVTWMLGGIPFDGTIFNAQDGRFQVERDGFGRTTDWVAPADLRLLAAAPVNAPAPLLAAPRPGPAAAPAAVVAPIPPAAPAPVPAALPPAAPLPPRAVAGPVFNIGDQVEWEVGGIWFPGIIYNVQNGTYQVNRDLGGRAREWDTAIHLRRLARRAEVTMIGFEGRKTPFRRGERVEVNLKGVWYRGTIGIADIDIDVYVVDRDHTPGDEMVSGAQIRRVVYAPPQ